MLDEIWTKCEVSWSEILTASIWNQILLVLTSCALRVQPTETPRHWALELFVSKGDFHWALNRLQRYRKSHNFRNMVGRSHWSLQYHVGRSQVGMYTPWSRNNTIQYLPKNPWWLFKTQQQWKLSDFPSHKPSLGPKHRCRRASNMTSLCTRCRSGPNRICYKATSKVRRCLVQSEGQGEWMNMWKILENTVNESVT